MFVQRFAKGKHNVVLRLCRFPSNVSNFKIKV